MRTYLAAVILLCLVGDDESNACHRRAARRLAQPCPPLASPLAHAPLAPLPFVLLSHATGQETLFATLQEAVAAAQDRDIIEVRGNGPFIASNLVVKGKELTIRAGEGYDPVFRPRPEDVGTGRDYLFFTDSPIHIRGLTLDGVGVRF